MNNHIFEPITVDYPSTTNAAYSILQEIFNEILTKHQEDTAWQMNRAFISDALLQLYNFEEKGVESGLNPAYYIHFNKMVETGFTKGLNKDHKLTHMGLMLIINEFCMASMDPIYDKPRKKIEKTSPYRIQNLVTQYTKSIYDIFAGQAAADRQACMNRRYARQAYSINKLDITDKNALLFPNTLRILSDVNKSLGIMPLDSAAYMTFPVRDRGHILDPDQEDNIGAFVQRLMYGFGRKGGCSALLEAGVGVGKTYAVIKKLAPKLGRMLDTNVYMLMPTTPQVAQAHEQYGANTNYGATTSRDSMGSDCLTAVIYDKASDIPTQVNGKPIVLFIDESHMLMTEKSYRNGALSKIRKLSDAVLDAGGIVIALTASSEIVAATMPYNGLLGYDIIAIAFRVSDQSTVAGKIYPSYEYWDVVQYGGVEILSAVPVDKICVYYRSTNQNMEKYIVKLIIDDIKEGILPVIENNDKDGNVLISKILTGLGYKVGLISADDKGYKFDEDKNCRIYNNASYEEIVNSGRISMDKVQVLITTKLLENGTSINYIKADSETSKISINAQYNVSTYHIVRRKDEFDMQAFEQFSGRIRCHHMKACLVLPMVEKAEKKTYCTPNLSFYIRKLASKKLGQVKAVAENKISAERLEYIDVAYNDDFDDSIVKYSSLTAQIISEIVYEALKRFYKSLMYNAVALEMFIRNRFATKEVSFICMDEPDIDIKKARTVIDAGLRAEISAAINTLYDGMGETDKKVRQENENTVLRILNDSARGSYKDNIKSAIEASALMKDISNGVIKAQNVHIDTSVIDVSDNASRAFKDLMTEAVVSTNKKASGAILNDVNMKFLGQIITVPGVDEAVKRFAYKKGHKDDYDIDLLVEDTIKLMGIYDFAEENRTRGVLMQLFSSDKFHAICKVLAVCRLMVIDLEQLVAFAGIVSEDKLNQVVLCYEYWYMAMYPDAVYGKITSSGRQFSSLFSEEAYKACGFATGFSKRGTRDISAWVNKSLTKDKLVALASFLRDKMVLAGDRVMVDIDRLSRILLRVFATVFYLKIRKGESGLIFTIQGIRKKLPKDFSKILSYNFQTLPEDNIQSYQIFRKMDDKAATDLKIKNPELDELENNDVFATADGYLARFYDETRRNRKDYYAVYTGTLDGGKVIGYHKCDMSGNVLSTDLNEDLTVNMKYFDGAQYSDFGLQKTVLRYVMDEDEFEDFIHTDMTLRSLFIQVLKGHYECSSDYTGPFARPLAVEPAA